MLDVFYIEGVYSTPDHCDTYTGEVSFNDIISGKSFNLRSHSGEEAKINLDMFTFNIDIAVNDKNGKEITRELRDIEFTTKDDGSWCINKKIDSDEFEITIKSL